MGRTLGVRWNKLRKMINLQVGPGAAVLPSTVTRIHMDFAFTMAKGHMGPRKFWKEYLPRLKYHNPSIPMILNRHHNNEVPPKMTIYLARDPAKPPKTFLQTPSSHENTSKAQPPTESERTVEINMQNKHSEQILEYFMAETRAVPLQPTEKELEELKKLEELDVQRKADHEDYMQRRAIKNREAEMLRRARAAGGMAEED